MGSVDFVGGRKLPFPIDKASGRKHRAGATAQPVMMKQFNGLLFREVVLLYNSETVIASR